MCVYIEKMKLLRGSDTAENFRSVDEEIQARHQSPTRTPGAFLRMDRVGSYIFLHRFGLFREIRKSPKIGRAVLEFSLHGRREFLAAGGHLLRYHVSRTKMSCSNWPLRMIQASATLTMTYFSIKEGSC